MVANIFELGRSVGKNRLRREAKINLMRTNLAARIAEKGGIVTLLDAFNVVHEIYPNFIWSIENIQQLSYFFASCPEFNRIDLQVTKDGHGKIPIYPGHHSISSTPFFTMKKETIEEQVEDSKKAKELLQKLIDAAKALPKKSTRQSSQDAMAQGIQHAEDENKSENTENSSIKKCKAVKARPNGYIPNPRVTLPQLHMAAAQMFGWEEFTLDELTANMPLGLYNTIVRIPELPKVLKDEPLLFNICMKSFPDSFLEKIDFQSGKNDIRRLLMKLVERTKKDEFDFLVAVDEFTFRLKRSVTIVYPPAISWTFELAKVEDINEVWRAIYIMELLERVVLPSNSLWRKRYALQAESGLRSNGTTKPAANALEKMLTKGFLNNFPLLPFQVEPFVEKIGYNFSAFENPLIKFRDDVRKAEIESLRTPSKGPVALFCRGVSTDGMEFSMNPASIIDVIDTKETFKWIKNVKAHVALNYITAQFSVSPTGVIISTPRQWVEIYELIKEFGSPTEEELMQLKKTNNAHFFSYMFHKDYHDLYEYNKANSSHMIRYGKEEFDDYCEVMTSQYNSMMLVNHLGWKVQPSLGEVIEKMKIISLCPRGLYTVSAAEKMLTQVDTTKIPEGVVYLKFMKFLSQSSDEKTAPYHFSTRNISELKQHIPKEYFADIVNDIQSIGKATFKDASLNGVIKSAPGSITYLTLPCSKAAVKLDSNKFTFGGSYSKPILSQNRSALPTDEIHDVFTIEIDSLPLPMLPEFSAEDIPSFEDKTLTSTPPITDFQMYPSVTCDQLQSAFMQIYTIYTEVNNQLVNEEAQIVFSEKDVQVVLFQRLIYAFILFGFIKGVSLQAIIDKFGETNKDFILRALEFLEEYNFVVTVHSTGAMPQFVSDVFATPHSLIREAPSKVIVDEKARMMDNSNKEHIKYELVKPHYWSLIHGEVSSSIIASLRNTICAIVRDSDGIEVLELADQMTSVSLDDILYLIDLMEADEVIYTRYYQSSEYAAKVRGDLSYNEEGDVFDSLFEDSVDVCVNPISNTEFLYEVSKFLEDPTNQERTKRKIFLSQEMWPNESLIINETVPELLLS